MPSWIGPWEIGIVLVLVLLIFGPRKLPELGKSLGKSIRGFRTGMKEGQDEDKSAVSEIREAADQRDAEPVKTEAKDTASESEKTEKTE
jgi:sec-independent protein translocase protein TatA